MDPFVHFAIPIQSRQDGMYHFDFQVDPGFFALFEESPIEGGQFEVGLDLEKRSGLFVLDFTIRGTIQTDCDRCLAPIHLPVQTEERLMVKLSPEARESDDPDIDYLLADAHELNVARYIYEFIVLASPIIKVYDCQSEEEPPCNQAMLDRLLEGEDDAEEEAGENPIWEDLKKLNIKRN